MINTYVSNGDKWGQITANNSQNMVLTTWDPAQINWNDYTISPVDITWTGVDPNNVLIGTPGVSGSNAGCFINGDTTWALTATTHVDFTKPLGVRPDVLMGFFSQHMHGLLFVSDESTFIMPFMERLGLIWIQHETNKWTAYDRKEFYEFIDNPEVVTFHGTALNKRDIHKRIAEAKDE